MKVDKIVEDNDVDRVDPSREENQRLLGGAAEGENKADYFEGCEKAERTVRGQDF